MTKIRSAAKHENLEAWQVSVDLAIRVIKATQGFPREERYALASQMRRAAVSVPSNLAEGNGLSSRRAFANGVAIARGSLNELRTQMVIAKRCGWLTDSQAVELMALADSVGRLLNGLYRSLALPRKD